MSSSNNPVRPVVVGVDGTPGSDGAVRYAAVEATRRGAPLHLVHVVPSYLSMGSGVPLPELHRIGADLLQGACEMVVDRHPELDVHELVVHGDPGRGVARAREDAQLVVVGRETRRGLDRLLTGTVTAAVAGHARCDVTVVPGDWTGEVQHGCVVVGVKDDRRTERLAAVAFHEASSRHARLTALSAWQLPDPYIDGLEARTHRSEWEAGAREALLHAVERQQEVHADVKLDLRVLHGSPAEVLVDAARDADLLVVGRHHTAVPPRTRLGSLAHTLVRVTEVPLLIVMESAPESEADADLELEDHGTALK